MSPTVAPVLPVNGHPVTTHVLSPPGSGKTEPGQLASETVQTTQGADGPALRAAARLSWAQAARDGRALSGAALGRAHGMSERWGRERAAEARAEHPHSGPAGPAADGTGGGGSRPAVRSAGDPAPGGAPWAGLSGNPAVSSGSPLVSISRDTARTTPAPVRPTAASAAAPPADGTGTPPVVVVPVAISPAQRRRSALGAAVAMAPGLVISWWSFTAYLRTGGTPTWLACLASLSVDGLAAYAALYATWFVDHGIPARMAKAATYGMVLISTLVNWSHAAALHWGLGQRVALAIPGLSAAVALELALMRLSVVARSRREQRRRTRLAAHVDRDLWFQHPVKVWRYRRVEGLRRLAEVFDQ